jgi:uncharacterized protein YcnI
MKSVRAPALAAALLLGTAADASAHAIVSPLQAPSGKLELYSLAVPTEKEGATTSKIVMTVPSGFSIDSFVPPPAGWHRKATSTKVTWTGGHTPTGEDSLFQFLAEPGHTGTYTFHVQQTYSDGSVVNWTGSESSDDPAPTLEATASLGGRGGGGSTTLEIVAVILGALGLLAGGAALVGRGNRPLV